MDFRFPTGRQAGRENSFQELAGRHPGLLLEKGLQMMKHHCSSVHGSGSGAQFPASAMRYLENVVSTLTSANLSDREVRERETLAYALGQLSRGSLAGLGDLVGPRNHHNALWLPRYQEAHEAQALTGSESSRPPSGSKMKILRDPGMSIPSPTPSQSPEVRLSPDQVRCRQVPPLKATAKYKPRSGALEHKLPAPPLSKQTPTQAIRKDQTASRHAVRKDQKRVSKGALEQTPWFLHRRMEQRAGKYKKAE